MNIREAVNGTVLNVVSNVLFSEDVVGLREQENQTFKRLVVPCAGGVVETQRLRSLPFLAPLEHLLGSRRRISTHLAKLFKFFDEVIIEKRLARGEKHNDILDMASSHEWRWPQITTFLAVRTHTIFSVH